MSSDNITPPQISEERLNELRQAENGALNFVTLREFRVIARAVIAERDRQWLERLEPVGETDLDGNFFAHDPLPDGTKVYRIKEQSK